MPGPFVLTYTHTHHTHIIRLFAYLVSGRSAAQGKPRSRRAALSGEAAGQDGPPRGVAASRLGSEILAATPPRVLRSRALENACTAFLITRRAKSDPVAGACLLSSISLYVSKYLLMVWVGGF